MNIVLYDRELEVMQVLWGRGPATVAEVRAALEDVMAYTTVLTVLRRLEEKGFVGHEEEGRAHRYHPLIEPAAARSSALERLTQKLFSGSRELLLTHLVSQERLSPREIRRLRRILDDRLEDGEES
jgi:predicted transcriptional regulator